MQNYWSKEDLANFDSSEVFKELETRIIDTIKRAEILNNKISEASTIEETTKSIKDLGTAAVEAGDAVKALDSAEDDADPEEPEEDLTGEVIDELRQLAQAAIAQNNIKLAYKIERTIDEILEQDVACE
jgi:hypothetical protein